MNEPSVAPLPKSPLVEQAAEYFSRTRVAARLGVDAAALPERIWNAALCTPVVDFLDRPSKEFRAELVRASYALAGGQGEAPAGLAHVVEVLHAGSLIVDDIQDESTARRGRPALHRQYGLPVALNAGNWLYFWSFALLDEVPLSDAVKLEAQRWMHRQLLSCHDGQGLDLTVRITELEAAKIAPVVLTSTRLKTGSLMKLAAVLGALAAGASSQQIASLAHFGEQLGIALQMLDDVGGLLSEARCHKGHEDLRLGRPTWPWAWVASDLPSERLEPLRHMSTAVCAGDLHPEVLARALRRALQGSGRVRVRRYLHGAFAELQTALGPSRALQQLEAELRRMERSYG